MTLAAAVPSGRSMAMFWFDINLTISFRLLCDTNVELSVGWLYIGRVDWSSGIKGFGVTMREISFTLTWKQIYQTGLFFHGGETSSPLPGTRQCAGKTKTRKSFLFTRTNGKLFVDLMRIFQYPLRSGCLSFIGRPFPLWNAIPSTSSSMSPTRPTSDVPKCK